MELIQAGEFSWEIITGSKQDGGYKWVLHNQEGDIVDWGWERGLNAARRALAKRVTQAIMQGTGQMASDERARDEADKA